ncbi:NAD(P)H-dependent oxidoreductase [Rhodococcus triatomae]|uniref:NAD(P)H-dependent FMN reductase n=1 Tax=Rhodococcus triatomae TaxID=300028 RepID=A0A1G8EWS0_9NOCA|nr:NAD(P)H-dependent oxidoreductase [Rhodococcus triatomae]QNG19318.1 NAD(P)H-dependent oxidoreductase [Rhodococcus triatomae]QNG24769.1 NAD(P)H-dependent oxidoreductase [Rhodococcus triatomae]SDH74372.1 NAD(P)H-dependent FMN reductase [Rhodococcus triatomae]
MSTNVLALVGSLRAASVNRQLAELAAASAPEGAEVTVYEGLADLPFYNEDLDVEGADLPAVRALRAAGAEADALLLLTPEYNGTIPAVLKNAIDWLSRPYGAGAVKDKPVAVISASPSQNGAVWAHEDTRKAVRIAGGRVLEDVTLSIGGTIGKFGDQHPRENAETVSEVAEVVRTLVDATKELASV